jgi:hypothetical protein
LRTYVIVTGVVFGLLTLAHVWRLVEPHLARDPFFIVATLVAAFLAVRERARARAATPKRQRPATTAQVDFLFMICSSEFLSAQRPAFRGRS